VHLETGLNRLLAESLRRGRGEEASVHKSTPALKMDSTVRPLQRAGGNHDKTYYSSLLTILVKKFLTGTD
jgi:hypothetical protein